MGLTWCLGFLATTTQWIVAWYSFTIVNSLQGAIITASFLSTRQVRRLLRQALCKSPNLTTSTATHSTRLTDVGAKKIGGQK